MKTLLLNSSYEVMSFIPFERAIKLYFNNKVEVLSHWDSIIRWTSGELAQPATLRLKYSVPWRHRKVRCTRKAVLKRDMFTCQYCSVVLTPSKLTWDHIIPRSRGGRSSWNNCVAACIPCNTYKGDRTPEEAKMKLLRRPIAPNRSIFSEYKIISPKHSDWDFYLA